MRHGAATYAAVPLETRGHRCPGLQPQRHAGRGKGKWRHGCLADGGWDVSAWLKVKVVIDVCIYVYTYTYITNIHICTHDIHIHTHIYIIIYIYTYMCVWVRSHTNKWQLLPSSARNSGIRRLGTYDVPWPSSELASWAFFNGGFQENDETWRFNQGYLWWFRI